MRLFKYHFIREMEHNITQMGSFLYNVGRISNTPLSLVDSF